MNQRFKSLFGWVQDTVCIAAKEHLLSTYHIPGNVHGFNPHSLLYILICVVIKEGLKLKDAWPRDPQTVKKKPELEA